MVNFEALALIRAIALCNTHAELDALAREAKAARGRLTDNEFSQVVWAGEDRRHDLDVAAEMWRDGAMLCG